MLMARIQITSSVTSEENKQIENQAAKEMLTKYKFIRKAVLEYCEECLKGEQGRRESVRQNNEETRDDGKGNSSVEDIE
jgi:hypothetical protein